MSEEVQTITRSRAINLINDSIESFFTFYDSYCYKNTDLTNEEIALYEQTNEVMMIVKNDENYHNDLKIMPVSDLTNILMLCKQMVEINDLSAQFSYPKGEFVIEEVNEDNVFQIGKDMSNAEFTSTDLSTVDLKQIKYFLDRYSSVSNWEYSGHGTFIAKKKATLWELGGIYWNKLFELPENPDNIQIGDEIKLKNEVIDTIYEYATKDVDGVYSFDAESPEVKEIIYSLLALCIGDNFGKKVEFGINVYDGYSTYKDITETTDVNQKLSYFIQQYGTEGLEEDGMRKFVSGATFIGSFFLPVFDFLGFMSTTVVDENKYQIVNYNQRKAFINSAEIEINRINILKENVKEKELQTEIKYILFLTKQIKMIKREIVLNKERDKQQEAEILYNFSKYNTRDAYYKDTRMEKSPDTYHQIDYYKLFKEQK